MRKMKNIVITILALIIVIFCFTGCDKKSEDKGNLPSNTQTTTKADITLTDSAVGVKPTESAVNINPTKPTKEEQAITTLLKDEIISGEVSYSQPGKSTNYTFLSEELQGFIDFFNGCKITKSDHKEPTGKHTASEDSIDVSLQKNDGTTIIFLAFSDGETYVNDGSDNGYALLNKDLSNYILGLKKHFI